MLINFKTFLLTLCVLITSNFIFVVQALANDQKGVFSVQFENDLLGSGSDKHYTHGTRLSYLSDEDDQVPEWVRGSASYIPLFASDGKLRISYSLGQNIYTPENIKASNLLSNDRPYAGWSYFGVGLVSDKRDDNKNNERKNRLDSLELNIGVVGPQSYADDIQTWWHREVSSSPRPMGWDHQLKNELGLTLTYDTQWQFLDEIKLNGFGVDILPHIGGALGNVHTYGAAGVTARLGQDLGSDYGPPRIRPSLPGSGFFKPNGSFGWYIFAGVEGRAVLRNIFLDGNTFTDSHSVSKKYFVVDSQVGLVLTFKYARVSFTNIFRSKEFDGQDRPSEFGAISISFRM